MSVPVALGTAFVRLHAPYIAIPRGGRRIAARIARDFVEVVVGFTERYNELNGTNYDAAQGLVQLLNSGVTPEALFTQYREVAEQSKTILNTGGYTTDKGFSEGWRWLTPEFSDWFVRVILPRAAKIDEWHDFAGAPLLTKVLIEHPRGAGFMRSFVSSLRTFLYPHAPPE